MQISTDLQSKQKSNKLFKKIFQVTDKQIVITSFPYKIKPEKTAPLSATLLPLFFPPSLNVSNVNFEGLVFHSVK